MSSIGIFEWVLVQAIHNGSISADWVLVGAVFVAFFLFWRMLYKIEKNLETVLGTLAIHNTYIELLKQSDEQQDEEIKELKERL